MPSVLDQVRAYQHVIEKYPQEDAQRVLRYIERLFRLDVTVGHLQETGVGRTVNALRKEPGDIGKAARALVYKWKLMVAAEESDQEGDYETTAKVTTEIRNGNDTESTRSRQPSYPINPTPKSQSDPHHVNGDPNRTKRKPNRNEEEEPEVKRQKSNQSSDEDHHNRKVKSETESQESDSLSGETDSASDSEHDTKHNDVSHKIKTEPLDEIKTSKHLNHGQDDERHKRKSDSSSNKHSRHSSNSRQSSDKKDKHSSKERSPKNSEISSKNANGNSKIGESSSQVHKERSKHKEKRDKHESTPSKDRKHSKEEKTPKHSTENRSNSQKPDSGSEKSRDKSSSKSEKHSSSHKSEKDKHKGSECEAPTEKHRSKEREHKSKDGSIKEHKSKDSSSDSKNKSSSSKEKLKETSSSKDKSRSHSDKSEKKSSNDKSKSDSKSKERDEKGSEKKSSHKSRSSSSHKSSSSKSRDEIPKKKAHSSPGDSDDGIGCESGASFAEALGMITPAKSKKKSTPVKDANQSSSTNLTNNDLSPAALLAPTAKLAPLPALEISALPEISPNYKPRPPPKFLPHFDDDAMSCVISSKNQRTKVYSGNKVIGAIPSLYDLCVNVLQEHIDALEYTGGVPYEILKPVIDKATPQQLFMLEHYNAYLIEDTDHLWQKHVEKHFRSKKREEMETWREMYLRCQEEQEYKLKSLTENIKLTTEAKKAPIKQTKMAYVDSVVKPPRNIARKQAVHGTKYAATASPAARVAALASASNVLRGGVRPSPAAPVSVGSFNKPKKAPLMQKALQFMRGRKR